MSTSQFTEADTIRILVATDNHVGYLEDHPIRTDDGWKAFDEIMTLAKTEDVDMVLLGGDLFHDHNPSRKAMFQVMRSLRRNCLGPKPCELQFLSDADQVFGGAFGHVNYEDQDINVAIPVFSIHGNHDEPSGAGNFCSLELLEVAGLVNYFGRVPEVDNIQVRPVLLQKGQTKLALYGLSNVRDERLFRTLRDHRIKWFRPNVQPKDWFNLLTVHQNHTPHNKTNYLPAEMLPDWMNLVVWGHEHECKIDPVPESADSFHVMQPGSSIATSLIKSESQDKHVAVVSITGRDFQVEKHRLRSVRPFVYRDLTLHENERFKHLARKKENRIEIIRQLTAVVEEMIDEANAKWEEAQSDGVDALFDESDRPLPLIRLRVDFTAPGGGRFDIENPQRFSQRFQGKVANPNDVVSFHQKKKSEKSEKATSLPEEALADMDLAKIKVKELVEEFLAAQSLKILPQAPFGDAVNQFVAKDDRHAMEAFVSQSLEDQVRQMLSLKDDDDDGAGDNEEEDLVGAMERYKEKLEKKFAAGLLGRAKRRKLKPRPDDWDSDMSAGHWEDQPMAFDTTGAADDDDEGQDEDEDPGGRKRATVALKRQPAATTAAKGRGGRKPAATTAATRKKKPVSLDDDEDDEEDVDMDDIIEDEDYDEVEEAPAPKTTRGRGKAAAATTTKAKAKAPAAKKLPARGAAATAAGRKKKGRIFEDDSDDEPPPQQEDDVLMEDDDDPPAPTPAPAARKRTTTAAATSRAKPAAAASTRSQSTRASRAPASASAAASQKTRQTKLNFSSQRPGASQQQALEISDDEILDGDAVEEEDDEEDDFESIPASRTRRR